MAASRGALHRLLAVVVAALEWFSSAVLLAMMVLTFVDVVGRYAFDKPVFGATELIGSLLALSIFAGLGVANARDDHISVELFDQQIRALAPRAHDLLVQGFSVAAMALIAWVLFEQAGEHRLQGARTVVIELPLHLVSGAVATLALISLFTLLGSLLTSPEPRK